ncbi:MAG: hypothetical protein NDF55_07410 [archaeon GB-1867-005]|nr:hypothetical protein [Candidatus Culexmicrobium cathedralense]
MVFGGPDIREIIVKFGFSPGDGLRRYFPLISRTISASLLISHGLRLDTRLVLLFSDGLFLRFEPRRLRHLRPDEQSTYGIVRKVIVISSGRSSPQARECFPGVFAGIGGLADFLKGGVRVFYADSKGVDLKSLSCPRDFKLVIGYPDLPNEDLQLLSRFDALPVRISVSYKAPPSLIILLHNYFDRTILRKR